MITENFNTEELTFNDIPKVLAYLVEQMELLKSLGANQNISGDTKTTLNIDEAAELIGKAKTTIYNLVHAGDIPAYKKGKKLYFIKEELQAWMHDTPTSIANKQKSSTKQSTPKGAVIDTTPKGKQYHIGNVTRAFSEKV